MVQQGASTLCFHADKIASCRKGEHHYRAAAKGECKIKNGKRKAETNCRAAEQFNFPGDLFDQTRLAESRHDFAFVPFEPSHYI